MPEKSTEYHPDDSNVAATYGFDSFLFFFVEVRTPAGLRQHDSLRNGYDDLCGALRFLAEFGFFTEEHLDVARHRLRDHLPDEIDKFDEGIRLAARVVVDMRRAAS